MLDNYCRSGEYLNLNTLTCDKCLPGTYSKGDVLNINEWKTIPNQFEVKVTPNSGIPEDKCTKSVFIGLKYS